MTDAPSEYYDLVIIGGGINGCGIARDAVGRGLKVLLCEQGDLAQATSSASTKLFHGGLRYLEYYEFRLVREALIERERLWQAMPHISWPLRFVLPYHKGLRPAWLIRLGLFIYDHLGGRKLLPPTRDLRLAEDPVGIPLKSCYTRAFEYSDCWVDDARLVVLNALSAAENGADIRVRTQFTAAERTPQEWKVTLRDTLTDKSYSILARGLVNAGGPWVDEIVQNKLHSRPPARIRLVRGSHIIVPRLFAHDRAYIFQNADNRIVFAIPYEEDFTLIGTTDEHHDGDPGKAVCSEDEKAYLIKSVSAYFEQPLSLDDIVWTYSGVRPLYDDGASSATAATRDYVLHVQDQDGQAPVLNVFGGKITTYRRLAESALAKLAPYYPAMGRAWTAGEPLPGGDFPATGRDQLIQQLQSDYPFLDNKWARRLVKSYGTLASQFLGQAQSAGDLGEQFGHNLTEVEVRWLMDREWAQTAEDVVWRRSKLGLKISKQQYRHLDNWMRQQINNSNR